jgi:hypothetical protein
LRLAQPRQHYEQQCNGNNDNQASGYQPKCIHLFHPLFNNVVAGCYGDATKKSDSPGSPSCELRPLKRNTKSLRRESIARKINFKP